MLDSLDAAAVRHWCAAGLDALRRHQREIDELNVYPVPDGDTGTNLVLTLTSAWEALERDRAVASPAGTPGQALRLMARGGLLGARGNSGVIVAQILRGMADALADAVAVDGPALARALRQAAAAAYAAVSEPVEGTILSVATASAEGAQRAAAAQPAQRAASAQPAQRAASAQPAQRAASAQLAERAGEATLAGVARAAATEAAEALARTPEQLPALARAGVVDAGGQGLLVLLDALVEVISGEAVSALRRPVRVHRPVVAARETGSGEFAYEVQYLLDATEDAVAWLRGVLGQLGDSLAVVGAGSTDGAVQTWNVHVHVNDVGAAIEAGVEAGRPYRISVTRFADQVAVAPDPGARAAVVVAPGRGLAELFAAEGTATVGGTPSTLEILRAVRSTGAERVVVLPNDPNSQAVAAAAAAEAAREGIVVRVIPTRCPVQALAALAVRDAARPFEDDVIAMAEAAGACRYAEVTVASREALTVAGRCVSGDILALVEGEVQLIGKELTQTCRDLLDRLLSVGGELVTLIVGTGGPEGLGDLLTEHARAAWPFVEVQVYAGGQPHYPLLVGVE